MTGTHPMTEQRPAIARADLVRMSLEIAGLPLETDARWEGENVWLPPRRLDSFLTRAVREHLNLGPEPTVVEVLDAPEEAQ